MPPPPPTPTTNGSDLAMPMYCQCLLPYGLQWECTENLTCTRQNDDARIHEPETTPSENQTDIEKCEPDEMTQGQIHRRVMMK